VEEEFVPSDTRWQVLADGQARHKPTARVRMDGAHLVRKGTTMTAIDLAETLPSALGHGSYADWYDHHWEPTRNLATRLLRDAAAAEDVAAEVLCRVWARWQSAGVPRWPAAYLAQATRNAVASTIRRNVRDRRMLERLESDRQEPDPGDRIAERAAVADLLDRLPPAEREAVVLYYLEELSADEIATRLGIRPSSVRSRLCRSRRRLAGAA
jgi:RNA polymerase sigma factor (sigma-70 family)